MVIKITTDIVTKEAPADKSFACPDNLLYSNPILSTVVSIEQLINSIITQNDINIVPKHLIIIVGQNNNDKIL